MSSKQLATLQEHLNTGAPNPNQPDTHQRILDEDAYVDTLQHIITRDFYPDLFRLNKQNQHIDKYGDKLFISIISTDTYYPCTIFNSSIINRYGTPLKQDLTPTPIKQYQEYQKRQQNKNKNKNHSKSTPSNSFEAPTPTPIRDNHNHNHISYENE